MEKYSPKEEIISVLNKEDIGYFPRTIVNWVPVIDVMKAIGQSSLWNVFYVPEAMAELALATHEICRWKGIQIGWASTIEMEAMGCKIKMDKTGIGDFPKLEYSPFNETMEIEIDKNEVLHSEIFNVMFKATSLVKKVIKEKYSDGIPIYASVIAPFTIASYAIDMNKFFKLVLKAPDKVRKILDEIADVNILYAEEMLQNGADFLHISDPVAQGLNEVQFRDVLLPSLKKIRDKFPDVKIIFHVCGKTGNILRPIVETGFDGFSFDYPPITYEEVKEGIGDEMAIIGSVPTITHMLEGSRDQVIDSSLDFINKGVDILSGSCCPPPGAPLENLTGMAEAIEKWNREKYSLIFE